MSGGDKDRLMLGNRSLVQHIIKRINPQVQSLVLSANGVTVAVTGTEARLLTMLMQSPHSSIAREALCQILPSNGQDTDTRRLESLVCRLRSDVAEQAGELLPVHTFRNQGYAFTGPQ